MLRLVLACAALIALLSAAEAALPSDRSEVANSNRTFERLLEAQRQSCKAVNSCREAVEMWCAGYRRADADNDGIPCENVCSTKEEVDLIRAEIDC